MKMLRFTNRAAGREGDPIYINADSITAIYENHVEGGSLATVIYGGSNAVEWYVEESMKEVIKIIEGRK